VRTAQQYVDKLKSMRPNVYRDGKIVPRDDSQIMPGINVISTTFNAIQQADLKDLAVVTSHLTGEPINRFAHIHQNKDDLLAKQEMTRVLCQKVGGCIQRCMGVDALNALSVVTKEIDEKHGTEYYERFLAYLEYYQQNDLVGNCAQTDVKGDRSKRPHQQQDPDLYLRVVEKRKDGIVVRGAKAHNTVAPYADEILVVPTRALAPEDADWAVAFAIPADTEGVKLLIRSTAVRPRVRLQAPVAEIGMSDSLTIFDNVFVPWERVFMCGEWEYGGRLAALFATYHRHSYTGCKPGIADVIMGAAALVAEYNGISKAQHVRDKIADLIAVAELVYSGGIAASVKCHQASSGTCIPNTVYTNVARYHAGTHLYHEYETLADLAGGLIATLPPEADWYNPETQELLEKYIMRNPNISAENQHRCFRMISDLLCSSWGGVQQVAGLHGGGSPIMEKIAITQQYDLDLKKDIAKYLAGIKA